MEVTIRDQMIIDKTQALQHELEVWAQENSILQPGERIVFSLRVESYPTVVIEEADSTLLDLSVEQFFSYERIQAAGVPENEITRINNAMRGAAYSYSGNLEYPTMREFMKKHGNAAQMLRIPYIGQKSVRGIAKVLKANGIHFDPGRYD